jgi:hypothetical protein
MSYALFCVRGGSVCAKLIPQKKGHLVEVETRLFQQMVAESLQHWSYDATGSTCSNRRGSDITELPHIAPDGDGTRNTPSGISDLDCGQ